MASLEQAKKAQAQAVAVLDAATDVVSVGISAEAGSYVLRVGVESTADVTAIPESVEGVPVRIVDVGRPTALT